MRDQPLGPVVVSGRENGSISVSITPQPRRLIPRVVCLEDPAGCDLSFDADIKLVAFRDPQVLFNGPERIPCARYVAEKPETRRTRRGWCRRDARADACDHASDLVRR